MTASEAMRASGVPPFLLSRRGFTLVELLTASAVMLLMVAMIVVLLHTASFAIANGGKHLDADGQARQLLGRMQMDFERMLKRDDVYFRFSKLQGNDRCTFYSETSGLFAGGTAPARQSTLSLVSYQFDDSHRMVRYGQGCQWGDVAFSASTEPVLVPTNGEVISPSVFRFELAFLIRQGDTSLLLTGTPPAPGSQAFQNLRGILIAIAVLDANSQKLLQPGNYGALVAALPDFTGSQALSLADPAHPAADAVDPILSAWRAAVEAPGFASAAGIPPVVAQQVRLYQRIVYLQ